MKKRYIVGICLLAVLLALAERDVLSVYGSEDGVLNMGKYESNRGNLPETTAKILIPGGNHAFFGCYGPQDGDGEAAILPKEQIQAAAEIIAEFVHNVENAT